MALNGDGGDEAFLGYERYWANHIADRLKMLPGASTGASFLKRMIADSVQSKSNARRVRRFLNVATMDEKHRYAYWIGYFGSHEKRRLYRPEFAALVEPDAPLDWYDKVVGTQPGLDAVERPNLMDIHSYLPYDLLVKVDIATMASSLEARSPLLDHHLLEYAARLPRQHKLQGRRGKSVLRSAFSEMLPPENVNRRKAGFGVPIGAWFRGPMREMLEEHLRSSSAQIRNYLDGAEIDRILDDHLSQRADYTYKIWNLLMLEIIKAIHHNSRHGSRKGSNSMDQLNILNTTGGMITACIFFILGIIAVQFTQHRDTIQEQTRLFVIAYFARMAMIVVVY